MHWIGLRIGLWPFAADFADLEERIDKYLRTIELTPRVLTILKARISEDRIVDLHLRLEGGLSFFQSLIEDNGVRDSIISSIKLGECNMALSKAEIARRAAQSAKDKKQAAKHKPVAKKMVQEINSGGKSEKSVAAPAAKGFETATTFRRGASNRFEDGIVVEGQDHLEYVAVPSNDGRRS